MTFGAKFEESGLQTVFASRRCCASMPKAASDVDSDFQASDGSTSSSDSDEAEEHNAASRRVGRPVSRVHDDPEYSNWHAQGGAGRCGRDAASIGVADADVADAGATHRCYSCRCCFSVVLLAREME
jgi:hypothetical protein